MSVTVSEAVARRRSIRAFTDRPVETDMLVEILRRAARAPSGGNLQPWQVYLLNGPSMTAFREMMEPRIAAGDVDSPEYPVYPSPLKSPYRERRFAVGEALYARLGIPREDKAARLAWFAENYRFFHAPAALFLFVDRDMGAAQWSDLGGYLQTVMLLLVEAGLASCPQEAWFLHHSVVQSFVEAPEELMLFCGLSIGEPAPEAAVNGLVAERADPAEWLTVL
ncbi:MAG: nitroreductase [Pseudomonadota bacterium]